MRFLPADEEEQMVLSEALLTAAMSLKEDAALDDRRGRYTSAERNREEAAQLLAWRDALDDMEV